MVGQIGVGVIKCEDLFHEEGLNEMAALFEEFGHKNYSEISLIDSKP
jgi:hypothetical protein